MLSDETVEMRLLKRLIDTKDLHHVTHRCIGTLWEGLWFYKTEPKRPRGFELAGCILKTDACYEEAHQLCRPLGISEGAYGE